MSQINCGCWLEEYINLGENKVTLILAGHQPNYLPYLGFFHKVSLCDTFVIVDHVQFVKRGPFGWMNRNKIRTVNGQMWLTVPVLTKGKFHQKIIETQINNQLPWPKKHWRSMCFNYKKAPFFARYADFFEKVYSEDWEYLTELNETIIRYIIEVLGIRVKIIRSSELGVEGKGTELILNMCRRTGARAYLHGKHGQDYVDEKLFRDSGIGCLFQDFRHPVYPQLHQPFIPNLSVIDLLFNCGDESLRIIKNCGGIIEEAIL